MPLTVFFAIIFAALLHAIWNAMVKKGDDKYISLTAVVLGPIPISIVVIFFTPTLSFQSICNSLVLVNAIKTIRFVVFD